MCTVKAGTHKFMFIAEGWGARLREEREKAGLSQADLAHRNTQRGYETEKTAPDLRYLSDAESRGLDVGYVVTGRRLGDGDAEDPGEAAIVATLWTSLCTESRAAVLTILRSLASRTAGQE